MPWLSSAGPERSPLSGAPEAPTTGYGRLLAQDDSARLHNDWTTLRCCTWKLVFRATDLRHHYLSASRSGAAWCSTRAQMTNVPPGMHPVE